MDKRKNLCLQLGVVIPIFMILIIFLSIYLPSLIVHPKSNFLYANIPYKNNYYDPANNPEFLIKNNQLIQIAIPKKDFNPEAIKLFIYDITHKKSREISFQAAQALNIDTQIKSPEGFEVVPGSKDSGIFSFFFGLGKDESIWYLKGHAAAFPLNISMNENYYFRFVGWIKNGS